MRLSQYLWSFFRISLPYWGSRTPSLFSRFSIGRYVNCGGERGIRTLDTIAGIHP